MHINEHGKERTIIIGNIMKFNNYLQLRSWNIDNISFKTKRVGVVSDLNNEYQVR